MGEQQNVQGADTLTMAEAVEQYLAHLEMERPRSHPQRSMCKVIKTAFGARPVAELRFEAVAQWAQELLAAGYARATVHTYMAYTRAILLHAQRVHRIPMVTPVPSIGNLEVRRRFLSSEEWVRVRAALPVGTHRDVGDFLYATGWRRGEALSLRWEDVDFERGTVTLTSSKNGHGRTIPMPQNLRELLKRRKAQANGGARVFPISGHAVSDAFARACLSAGVPRATPHDLRRTAARDLIASGVDYATAMAITGHRTMSVFHRYQIVDIRQQAQALTALAAFRGRHGETEVSVDSIPG